MTLSNRTLLHKADAALEDLTLGGGYLRPKQSMKFMRLAVKESELLKQVTVQPMSAPKEPIPQIKFGARVLRPGQPGIALTEAERSKPDFSQVELDSKLFKGEVRLPDEVLEDNVERGQLRQTIMSLLAAAVGRDIEEVVIRGDRLSTDPFLAQLDGLLVQAQSHVVDAAGGPITKDLLSDLLRTLPSQYLRNKKQMRHYTSIDADLAYRNALAERATAVGDKFLEGDAPVMHSGVPLYPVPLFPEDLGAGADQTNILTTHPKNIVVGIWRQIKIRAAEDISEGTVKIVVTMRMDTKFADEDGVAKAIQVQL